MSLAYLLDINIVSEPLRPDPNPYIITRLEKYQEEIAIAKANDLILVTLNVADYADFQDLQIENWVAS
jgi:predicted nucleic acid-binding protein